MKNTKHTYYSKDEFNQAIEKMLEDCSAWDRESYALVESFERGIDFMKKQLKINSERS